MNSIQVNQYLWCGYLPPNEFPDWLSDCITPAVDGKEYSPREAAERFNALFDALVEQATSDRHIIPLSGGWDSRAILGALIERLDSDRIVTVTFGVPSQLDYDLGKMIADSVGVEHHAFDLRTVDFTWDAVRGSVAAYPWTHVPDVYFHSLIRNQFSNGSDTIWSGFLGDALTCSQPSDSTSDEERDRKFKLKLRRSKSTLCSSIFNDNDIFKIRNKSKLFNFNKGGAMRVWEIYLIAFSEAPIVTPVKKFDCWGALIGKEMNGARVIAPFADASWAGYWLTAPSEMRKGQKLYLEMLKLKYLKLFSLPTKSDLGIHNNQRLRHWTRKTNLIFRTILHNKAPLLRVGSPLMRNYLDYDEMFRTREDYKMTLATAFDYLKENRITPWLNLDKLWIDHRKHRKNYGDAFCVLIGLAANILENPLGEEDEK